MQRHGYSLNDLFTLFIENMQAMFDPNDFAKKPFDESDIERAMVQARDVFCYDRGFNGELFVSPEEFFDSEFLIEDYMRCLFEKMPEDTKELLAQYRAYVPSGKLAS